MSRALVQRGNYAIRTYPEQEAALLGHAAQHRTPVPEARFRIYRTDEVSLTSTLFGGGDWHWQLTGQSGAIIADCGGYRNEAQCLAAVNGLRNEAGLATVFRGS
jgi:uncharacterized protein YegP (UPF0339 family)